MSLVPHDSQFTGTSGQGKGSCCGHGDLLGAAFGDGPHLSCQYPAVWDALSHFNRSGLVMSDEAKLNASLLLLGNRIRHPCSCDVELQLVWAGDEGDLA